MLHPNFKLSIKNLFWLTDWNTFIVIDGESEKMQKNNFRFVYNHQNQRLKMCFKNCLPFILSLDMQKWIGENFVEGSRP